MVLSSFVTWTRWIFEYAPCCLAQEILDGRSCFLHLLRSRGYCKTPRLNLNVQLGLPFCSCGQVDIRFIIGALFLTISLALQALQSFMSLAICIPLCCYHLRRIFRAKAYAFFALSQRPQHWPGLQKYKDRRSARYNQEGL